MISGPDSNQTAFGINLPITGMVTWQQEALDQPTLSLVL